MKVFGLGVPELFIINLILAIVFCVLCSMLGARKGYTPIGFGVMGFFLGLIGLIIAAVVPDKKGYQASAADGLLKYKELLDKGVITQEEFEAKKKELLS